MHDRSRSGRRALSGRTDTARGSLELDLLDETDAIVGRLYTRRFLKKALGLALIAVASAIVAEITRDAE